MDPDGEYRWQEGARGGHGFTPLHCARSMAMVELLLSKGASLSAAPAGAELGGMAGVLMKWQHEADLPRLIERWLERGGRLDDPMESYRPAKMSLLSYVFQNVWEAKASPASSDWHVWQARRERAHVIQNVLVGNGWVDLDQTDSQGVSWRQRAAAKETGPGRGGALPFQGQPSEVLTLAARSYASGPWVGCFTTTRRW